MCSIWFWFLLIVYYLEKGLPVIPFGQPILPDRDYEAGAGRDSDSHLKKLRGKSNDLKKELLDFHFWNKPVLEEDEDGSPTKSEDKKGNSSSEKFLQTGNSRSRISAASDSPYMDTQLGLSSENPYMKMDAFMGSSQAFYCDKNMRRISLKNWSEEENASESERSTSLGRFLKKGNRHKAEYVYLDFEKNNYVDMSRISDKKWKSLTNFQSKK